MSRSLRVCASSIEYVKQAIQRNGFRNQRSLAEDSGIALSTVSNFLNGKPVDFATFVELCQKLSLDWQAITDAIQPLLFSSPPSNQDWGDALDVLVFYDRSCELDTLKRWLLQDRCRLVTVLGMGGIGKTILTAKLAALLQHEFEFVFWRSLRNAPPLEEVLTKLLQLVSRQQEVDFPSQINEISYLMKYLRSTRCLLVLDNAESLLQSGDRSGSFREECEEYAHLLQAIAETFHNSCLVLTSREKLPGLAALEGATMPVRSLHLKGLPEAAVQEIFQAKGHFIGSAEEWQSLSQWYGGNPLALKVVASAVQDNFNSNVSRFLEFLQQSSFVFDDICDLLERQFQRLNKLEQALMYRLAVNREPTLLEELQRNSTFLLLPSGLIQGLTSLQHRSLIEKTAAGYTLQPVVMEFVTTLLIEQIYAEITNQQIALLKSHAIVQAQAKDYIRETQIRLILQPLVERLLVRFGSIKNIEHCLMQILEQVRLFSSKADQIPQEMGYVAGNVLNLLRQLRVDLKGYDFSHLTVWQANLQGLSLHNVNFAYSNLCGSVFSQAMGNLLAATFSPDGKLLATGDTDNNIRLWDAHTGQQILLLKGHKHWVRAVAFSPDGQTLVSGAADYTVRLWDVYTGQCRLVCSGHQGGVYSVAVSPNGQTIASSSADHTVMIWDSTTGHCLKTLNGHTHWVRAIAYSPDGQLLVSGSADCTIKVWDVATGQCIQTWREHTDWVYSVAFSADGQTLASGSGDRTLKLWDVCSGNCLHTCSGHSNGIYAVAISPGSSSIVSSSLDRTIKLWDVKTGRCLKTLIGHTNQVCSVVFHPAGQTIASVSLDQTVKFWDINTGACFKTCSGYNHWVYSVAFSPNGKTLCSTSMNAAIQFWDICKGKCFRTCNGHTNQVYAICFSPDGQTLASASADHTVKLWEASTGHLIRTLPRHTDWVYSVAYSPDGQTIASASADRTTKVWDVSTGSCLRTLNGHNNGVYSVKFSPDGQQLASASLDKTVKLWDWRTGECVRTLTGHTDGVYSIAFSSDGCRLVSGSADCTLRLWQISTGQCLQIYTGHTSWVYSVAVSSDDRQLASASFDQTVKLWDTSIGRCCQTLTGHTNLVTSVAYGPSTSDVKSTSQLLASGSVDETVRLWDANTGKCIMIISATRLYEGMNITGTTGLTNAQIAALKALGAVEAEHEAVAP